MCCPGGKTTHIAQLMRNQGVLVATTSNFIVQRLCSQSDTPGVKNAIVATMMVGHSHVSWADLIILLDARTASVLCPRSKY